VEQAGASLHVTFHNTAFVGDDWQGGFFSQAAVIVPFVGRQGLLDELDAEQVVTPLDHALRPESEVLPAIAVVRLPNGLTHFVVVWATPGPWVQVMDPGSGRGWGDA